MPLIYTLLIFLLAILSTVFSKDEDNFLRYISPNDPFSSFVFDLNKELASFCNQQDCQIEDPNSEYSIRKNHLFPAKIDPTILEDFTENFTITLKNGQGSKKGMIHRLKKNEVHLLKTNFNLTENIENIEKFKKSLDNLFDNQTLITLTYGFLNDYRNNYSSYFTFILTEKYSNMPLNLKNIPSIAGGLLFENSEYKFEMVQYYKTEDKTLFKRCFSVILPLIFISTLFVFLLIAFIVLLRYYILSDHYDLPTSTDEATNWIPSRDCESQPIYAYEKWNYETGQFTTFVPIPKEQTREDELIFQLVRDQPTLDKRFFRTLSFKIKADEEEIYEDNYVVPESLKRPEPIPEPKKLTISEEPLFIADPEATTSAENKIEIRERGSSETGERMVWIQTEEKIAVEENCDFRVSETFEIGPEFAEAVFVEPDYDDDDEKEDDVKEIEADEESSEESWPEVPLEMDLPLGNVQELEDVQETVQNSPIVIQRDLKPEPIYVNFDIESGEIVNEPLYMEVVEPRYNVEESNSDLESEKIPNPPLPSCSTGEDFQENTNRSSRAPSVDFFSELKMTLQKRNAQRGETQVDNIRKPQKNVILELKNTPSKKSDETSTC